MVDRDLNSALVRMYDEQDDPSRYAVKVEESLRAGETPNPFYRQISALVNPTAAPWSSFSSAVAEEIEIRRRNLEGRIHDKG